MPNEFEGLKSAEASKLLSSLGDLGRSLGLVAVLFYVAGLFIVNIHLGRLGVVDLELARPEFVLVGAIWFVLTVAPAILFLRGRELLRESRSKSFSWRELQRFAYYIAKVLMLLAFSIAITRPPIDLVNPRSAEYFVVIVCGAWIILPTKEGWSVLNRALAKGGEFGPAVTWELWELTVCCLVAFAIYSVFVFPSIAKEWGGGYAPSVELILYDSSNIPWTSLSITASADGKKVGPVRLLFENQSEILVASSGLRGIPDAPLGKPIDVVLDKKMISATLYLALQQSPNFIYRVMSILLGSNPTPKLLTNATSR
jgi:hypothetical protein